MGWYDALESDAWGPGGAQNKGMLKVGLEWGDAAPQRVMLRVGVMLKLGDIWGAVKPWGVILGVGVVLGTQGCSSWEMQGVV